MVTFSRLDCLKFTTTSISPPLFLPLCLLSPSANITFNPWREVLECRICLQSWYNEQQMTAFPRFLLWPHQCLMLVCFICQWSFIPLWQFRETLVWFSSAFLSNLYVVIFWALLGLFQAHSAALTCKRLFPRSLVTTNVRVNSKPLKQQSPSTPGSIWWTVGKRSIHINQVCWSRDISDVQVSESWGPALNNTVLTDTSCMKVKLKHTAWSWPFAVTRAVAFKNTNNTQ